MNPLHVATGVCLTETFPRGQGPEQEAGSQLAQAPRAFLSSLVDVKY